MRVSALFILCAGMMHAAPVALFDGKTLDGWKPRAGEEKWWTVKDGAITGGSLDEQIPHNTFLASAKSYQNFELTYQIRLVRGEGFQNSGLQIRSKREENHQMKGYQVDAGTGYWGDLYDEGRRAKLCGPLDPEALKAVVKDWDWNKFRVLCEGPRIRVWINGVAVTDFTEEDDTIPRDGLFGLQAHGGGKFLVQMKDVLITELPPTPGAATWEKPDGAREPEEQRQGFRVPEGFSVELVSSEKQGVHKPITVAWDRHGRMWTMTATEYPLDANENKEAAEALYAAGGRDRLLVFDEPNRAEVMTPRVFAEGLAMPLGILPMKDGVLAQYGTQIRRYIDDDRDGRADRHEVVLEGFGVQDSHLFAHQFERAPGGWIHLAQGAFNSSNVRRPGGLAFADGAESIPFNHCKLGRFKPDGSLFEAQTAGPNNIWGLVISRSGETYIQEANDHGHPVVEFIPGSNYPTGFGPRLREDAPLKPVSLQGNQMGGTGLSGLALAEDAQTPFANDPAGREVFYIANPITSKIQTVTMERDAKGRPVYQKGPDFMLSDDPHFRPIACHFGPDGCLYVVDWYNKIISHNEVARTHPDRDKTSGRIWRVRHKDLPVPERVDLAALTGPQLLNGLGGPNARLAAMTWQEIADRGDKSLAASLHKICLDKNQPEARRLGALWALEGLDGATPAMLAQLTAAPEHTLRHEAVRIAGEQSLKEADFLRVARGLKDDPHYRVRAALINAVRVHRAATPAIVALAAHQGREPLFANDRDAYDREFERYLARWAMSAHPDATRRMMRDAALPAEAAVLAARSFEGGEAARLMVGLLGEIKRPLLPQELALLGRHMAQPEVLGVMNGLLESKAHREATLRAMLQLDPAVAAIPELAAAVGGACAELLRASRTAEREKLVVDLARRFRIASLASEVRAWAFAPSRNPAELAGGLATLREIGAVSAEDCARFLDHEDDTVRREAVTGFATLPGAEVVDEFAGRWAGMPGALRSLAVDGMTSNPAKAEAYALALAGGKFGGVDGSIIEKITAALGDAHPALDTLLKSQKGLLKPVIRLGGGPDERVGVNVTLEGPFTVECWIRLDADIGAGDGLLGRKGGMEFNFHQGRLRIFGGPDKGDLIVANRTVKAGEWIHCAVTRDATGRLALYFDGDPDTATGKTTTETFAGLNIGETSSPGGAAASYDEYRIWNVARAPEEIRADFRTDFTGAPPPAGLVLRVTGETPDLRLEGGAKRVLSRDFPELVTPRQRDESEAKFRRYREMVSVPGDVAKGRVLAEATCLICHQVNGKGMAIGPDLSGAGAMGTESILRNILTPNEQLESGYYRHDIRLNDGTVVSGFLAAEAADSLTIRRIGADELVIRKSDVASHDISRRSLMPEGLLEGFSEEQVRDLFSYLHSLQ
jgi:putative membrane-bound dehydrogenase-like protein